MIKNAFLKIAILKRILNGLESVFKKYVKNNKENLILLGVAFYVFIIYLIPVNLESEWFDFFSYLETKKELPFTDIREGYPPLGFLFYVPLYFLFKNNEYLFTYAFRIFNGILLIITFHLLHKILKKDSVTKSKYSYVYILLPSVIISNSYSNDIIALLPAVISIYMMLQNSAELTALFIGVATLGKGFPLVLVIPALIHFTDLRDRIKIISVIAVLLVVTSLPFMLINPLTYISTFQHHSSRGPWETIWALLEGYYSHGGFLHPFFDKYFYHSNLLKIYSPATFDHVIYSWNYNCLPIIVSILGKVTVIYITLKYYGKTESFLRLSGLVYISYILFFKGYSTQFSVSTQLFTLLASLSSPLYFVIPLEIAHILQMFAWWNIPSLSVELIRNQHLFLIKISTILRTIIFSVLLINGLKVYELNWENLVSLFKDMKCIIKKVNNQSSRIIIFLLIISTSIFLNSIIKYKQDSNSFREFSGSLEMDPYQYYEINLEDIKPGDQVFMRFNTSTMLDIIVESKNGKMNVDSGTRNPFNLKGTFNERLYFFKSNSESCTIKVKTIHPKIPMRITDRTVNINKIEITEVNGSLKFILKSLESEGEGNFRFVLPIETVFDEETKFNLQHNYEEGIERVLMDIFDETDEWIYSFNTEPEFNLTYYTKDLEGFSNHQNDEISLVGISLDYRNTSSVVFTLNNLEILKSNISYNQELFVQDKENIDYELYVERDFKPTPIYIFSLLLSVILGIIFVRINW
jgi:hypothetical protein